MPIRKSTEDYPPPRKSDELAAESYSSDRRRPSQDTTGRRSGERERDYGSLGRRQSQAASVHSDSTSATNAQSATAGMGMIIPNKSTIAEEDIEVPYGREMRDSTGTATDDRSREHSRGGTDAEMDEVAPLSPPSAGLGGLSGLTARLQAATAEDDDEGALSGGGNKSDDYYDKMSFGRASVASDRSTGGMAAVRFGGRSSVTGGAGGEEGEKIRREYEFRIATMQTRITGLERDLEDAQLREQKWAESEERVRTMEDELEELRRVSRKIDDVLFHPDAMPQLAEEKTASMLLLQKELDELREDREREKEMEARRAQEDEEELQILRQRCERLETEHGGGGVSSVFLLLNFSHLAFRLIPRYWTNCEQTWKAS